MNEVQDSSKQHSWFVLSGNVRWDDIIEDTIIDYTEISDLKTSNTVILRDVSMISSIYHFKVQAFFLLDETPVNTLVMAEEFFHYTVGCNNLHIYWHIGDVTYQSLHCLHSISRVLMRSCCCLFGCIIIVWKAGCGNQ